jgi:uncharacterized protein
MIDNHRLRIFALAFTTLAIVAALRTAAAAGIAATPIPLKVDGHSITAEVAATLETRARGLMFRTKLGKNAGMLFVFDQLGYHGMWMKNTLIPLSVAFIDEHGKILNIAEMEPHSEITHSATGPARYALEMNAGWFSARKIAPGSAVKGIDKAPKGE